MRTRTTRTTQMAGAIGALAVWLVASGAAAEGFVDVYLGGAFTDSEKVDVTAFGGGGPLAASARTDFEDAAVGGIRAGYWIDPAPFLGMALDISGFQPDEDGTGSAADIAVVPISALLMLRIPIGATDEIPGGRIQPYGAVGPAAFVSAYGVELDGIDDFGDVTADIGLDARAGLKVQVLRWLAIFAEYRYTRFDPEWSDRIGGVETDVDTDLATHHVNVGLGFHF